MKVKNYKLWGGLQKESPDELMLKFAAGRDVTSVQAADELLIPFDIAVNKAHCKMLSEVGLLDNSEAGLILDALQELEIIASKGGFKLDPELEDVHTNVENFLMDKLGVEVAGKIHTGRSRNDQVTTDMFLYTRAQVAELLTGIDQLAGSLDKIAEQNSDVVCPGYTHTRPAVVTTLGEIFAGFAASIQRDKLHLQDLLDAYNYSPLGAATGYGTILPIDPESSATELGFAKAFESSIDVITNRGEFEYKVVSDLVGLFGHLSTMAQTLIFFSGETHGFVTLPDRYTTGSSIMPQKKNPDFLELIRAKGQKLIGIQTALAGILNSNFIGYNRDSQETKYLIIDAFADAIPATLLFADLINGLEITEQNKTKMHNAASTNFINTTAVMERLIMELGLPMRSAKKICEVAVREVIAAGRTDLLKISDVLVGFSEQDLELSKEQKQILEENLASWQLPENCISATASARRRRRRRRAS